ncbi:MAG: hypothetical protein ACR2RF_03230 [Geminicoccaceae bacterium]
MVSQMRLRYALISLFLILTAVPLTVFWAWPHSQMLQSEFDDVRDRHLLLARNLGAALERYHQDVLTAFNLVANNVIKGRDIDNPQDLLLNLSFRHICIAEEATGKVVSEVSPAALPCPAMVPDKRMYLFARLAREDRAAFSEVLEGPGGVPVMYVIRRVDDLIAIGALNTDYFVSLGKAISFGVLGHGRSQGKCSGPPAGRLDRRAPQSREGFSGCPHVERRNGNRDILLAGAEG